MNYDGMSVRELVREIAREESLAHDIGVTGDDWVSLTDLESALRHKVIEEASVGTIRMKAIELYFDCEGRHKALIAEPLITVPPDGDYDLIPHKETQ